MKSGLYTDLSNAEYHAQTDFLSSSMLKLILDSPEMYYRKYVLKDVKNEHKDVYDTGTAIHTRILENYNYDKTVTSFSGVRRGKNWEEFKAANEGKIILGDIQKMQVDRMHEAFLKSELGPKLIKDGTPEYSLFTTLADRSVKVRADYLKQEGDKITIFDVKSTSGLISPNKFIQGAESKMLGYDLQAAFYVDAYKEAFTRYVVPASSGVKTPESFSYQLPTLVAVPKVEFVWIVISKDFDDIKFFKATPELIQQGREKYLRAIKILNKYEQSGWDFKKEIIEVYPTTYGGF